MGHPLASSIIQRFGRAVAAILHRQFSICAVAYLNDWLIFGASQPAQDILRILEHLGLPLNRRNCTSAPVFGCILGPGPRCATAAVFSFTACTHRLLELVTSVPHASLQVLRSIAGYATWLAWVLAWPIFAVTALLAKDTCCLSWIYCHGLTQQPQHLSQLLHSRLLYSEATRTSLTGTGMVPPWRTVFCQNDSSKPIAYVESATALITLFGLEETMNNRRPFLYQAVFHIVQTGKRRTCTNMYCYNNWMLNGWK